MTKQHEQQHQHIPGEIRKLLKLTTEPQAISDERYEQLETAAHKTLMQERISRQVQEIPARYRSTAFEHYQCTSDRQRAVVTRIRDAQQSFLLYGGNGTGKTMLAFAKYRQLIESGKQVKYILAMDFFDEVKQSFADQSTRKLIEAYSRCDYLIIDEIDKRYGSQHEYLQLYRLINARYNELKHTMLITNADRSQLVEVVGQSVIDRLIEDGEFIELAWDSYRKTQRKEKIQAARGIAQ
mgnify:CR=1 FL=1